MPFAPEVLKTFHALPARPDEGQVVTAYKDLLAHFFPQPSDFKISGERTEPTGYQAVHGLSVLTVKYGSRPVLKVLVNNPEHFVQHSARQQSDEEIRALLVKQLSASRRPDARMSRR